MTRTFGWRIGVWFGVAVVAGTAAWADALSKVPFVDPSTTQCFGPASGIVLFDDGTSETVSAG